MPTETHNLQSEAGRQAWEDAFSAQHLAVLSGDPVEDQRRLIATASELRQQGDAATFAAELLAGGVGTNNSQVRKSQAGA